jgi:triosephosphate isomerase
VGELWKILGTQFERQVNRIITVITRPLHLALKKFTQNDIDNVEVTYEPVSAIGTGRNATSEQIPYVHVRIQQFLEALSSKRKRNAVRAI